MDEPLVCTVDAVWPAPVVRPEGRLDMYTAPKVRASVHSAWPTSRTRSSSTCPGWSSATSWP